MSEKQAQLMEYITQDLIAYITEDECIEPEEAMKKFYSSQLYEKIMDPETGLYLEGSGYIYDLYRTSKNGKLVQNEY